MGTNSIRFLLDGETISLEDVDPTATVLDLLRYRLRRTGTKEGCAEGDCGACTVLVGTLADEDVMWRAVNACILFVPMLHGKALLTVESLGGAHPVQREIVERHGSQCGFCTPGFVMSLYARSIAAVGTRDMPVADVIAGNLCRCTGYGPIIEAGEAVPMTPREDTQLVAQLKSLASALLAERSRGTASSEAGMPIPQALNAPDQPFDIARAKGKNSYHLPRTADELAALLLEYPGARLVAGATDVGLWVTKHYRDIGETIFIADIADLAHVEEDPAGLTLGAAVRYSDAWPALARIHPQLGELVRRIGGPQVRNAGTIGGNIANGSPIGDIPPALIALGAMLTLRRRDGRRTIPLEDYFIAYGKQDLAPGEFVESVFVPRPSPGTKVAINKLSKRFDSDISAVCGACAIQIENGTVSHARIAFGGMAGTPRRARACEAALIAQPWAEQTIVTAMAALGRDFTPLDDVRGSAAYRSTVAANLLRRLWLADGAEPLSVLDLVHEPADG